MQKRKDSNFFIQKQYVNQVELIYCLMYIIFFQEQEKKDFKIRIYQFVYEEHGMHKQLMKLNQQKKII